MKFKKLKIRSKNIWNCSISSSGKNVMHLQFFSQLKKNKYCFFMNEGYLRCSCKEQSRTGRDRDKLWKISMEVCKEVEQKSKMKNPRRKKKIRISFWNTKKFEKYIFQKRMFFFEFFEKGKKRKTFRITNKQRISVKTHNKIYKNRKKTRKIFLFFLHKSYQKKGSKNIERLLFVLKKNFSFFCKTNQNCLKIFEIFPENQKYKTAILWCVLAKKKQFFQKVNCSVSALFVIEKNFCCFVFVHFSYYLS